jgi:nitrogenase molybdenum-cofactor synthesis protein NifE
MSLKQTVALTSTYSADLFGVVNTMFELGGLVVIHDPSGCNSTYATHDEPRWYDMDSMYYISGLTEMDAILGNDDKLVHDVVEAAQNLHPRFIVLLQSQIPFMTGMDLPAAAAAVQAQCGLPTFALPTNSMHYYLTGVSMALALLAEQMVQEPSAGKMKKEPASALAVNILGLAPLDFSYNGSDQSLADVLTRHGFKVISRWAMGSRLDDIIRAGEADVNLVVSYGGLEAARILQRRFGTPYVIGVPLGQKMADLIAADLRQAAQTKQDVRTCARRPSAAGRNAASSEPALSPVLIGESVYSTSLALALSLAGAGQPRVFCPLETEAELLGPGDQVIDSEAQLQKLLAAEKVIIADPLYQPICPAGAKFIRLPHEGFSGRLYRKEIPNLISGFEKFAAPIVKP